jgi:hypothetical protein
LLPHLASGLLFVAGERGKHGNLQPNVVTMKVSQSAVSKSKASLARGDGPEP